MNIGVIGYGGTVGSALLKFGYKPINCDVTNPKNLRSAVDAVTGDCDVIIYAAGVTNVEYCEDHFMEAKNVNTDGVSNLVDFYRGKLIYISTDHIFSGNKFLGLGYTEKHSPNPANRYGRTKLVGEWMAFAGRSDSRVIRTSKLFDWRYITKAFNVWAREIPMEFTNVLKRSFLHIDHFVEGIDFVVHNWDKIPRILNISGTDIISHYMFFCSVANHLGIDSNLLVARNYYDKKLAPRPRRGGLSVELARSLGVPLYSVYEGIKLL